MPNWVFNSLEIAGSSEDISKLKEQVSKPFTRAHENWDKETQSMQAKDYTFSNPIFSFWNIIKPTDLEAYAKQPDHSANLSEVMEQGNDWYNWNCRNWGCKWDVAVSDDSEWPETELLQDTSDSLVYKFNTPWSPPLPAIAELSTQYPNLTFTLFYQEEQGWGGQILFVDGNGAEIESYESKCMDCDEIDTLEYCDNECGQICESCHYLGEADLEAVAECEVHKVFLDEDHVPEYRKESNV
jgi:hypothetical protein